MEAEKAIIAIREKIVSGEDFTELVRQESDDSGNDGNLGAFARGRMVPEFEKAAFSMQAGDLSDPVRTQFGWHLIQVKERSNGKLTPYDSLKEKIVEYLSERKKDSTFDAFLDRLKEKASIEEVTGI